MQARGSLVTLRSLSSILLPRLEDSDASKDLASGIAAQVLLLHQLNFMRQLKLRIHTEE